MQKGCLFIWMNPMRVDEARGLSFFANKTLFLVQILLSFWYQLVDWRLSVAVEDGDLMIMQKTNVAFDLNFLQRLHFMYLMTKKTNKTSYLYIFSNYKSPCLFTSRCTWRRLGRLKLLICCRLHIWQLIRSDKAMIYRWLTCIWRRIKLLTEVCLAIIVFTYYLLCRVSIIIPCKS